MTQFDSIVETLPDPLFFLDEGGRVVYWNRACEATFGVAAEQVLGRPYEGHLGADLEAGLTRLLSPVDPDRTGSLLPAVRIGEGFWDARVTPVAGASATAVHCVRRSGYPGWPELVVESADAIWVLDEGDRVIGWNRGAEEMFGYRSDEIIGQPLKRLIPTDLIEAGEPERLQSALADLGAVRDYPTRRVCKDGHELEVSLTRTAIPSNGGERLLSLTIVRDLSQRRQFERQMIESEKLATIGELAASVAQEIGAPVTTIGLIVDHLRSLNCESCGSETQLDRVSEQLSRIARLARGLVDLAKPGEIKRRPLRIGDVVARALELLEPALARAGLSVDVDVAHSIPEIDGDAAQLQQVFLNLLMNARRALEDQGDSRISVAARLRPGLPRVARPVRRVLEIELSDNGPGVDPADLPLIFSPFFSRFSGSGLGLTLAKRIIHAHGGTIEARSTPGDGATFTILLPVEPDEY